MENEKLLTYMLQLHNKKEFETINQIQTLIFNNIDPKLKEYVFTEDLNNIFFEIFFYNFFLLKLNRTKSTLPLYFVDDTYIILKIKNIDVNYAHMEGVIIDSTFTYTKDKNYNLKEILDSIESAKFKGNL